VRGCWGMGIGYCCWIGLLLEARFMRVSGGGNESGM